MANEPTTPPSAGSVWQATQVYTIAVICMAVGLAIGYLFRGSQSPKAPAATAGGMGEPMPSLEQLKQMANKKAGPLLEKLKKDPNNAQLLFQVGDIYKQAHQFKEAASYYEKSLIVDPKNLEIRTDRASCLYYAGDTDGALIELQQSLKYDPKDANTLFNIGMIRWKGKQDANGALAAWKELLKSNPSLDQQKKESVQKLIAEIRQEDRKPN
ncbi:MAG TPA: tetratricopeptide repeat protein [Terriglobales bacterium]|nr:tetratricopeptide repeat protein [Terriglobales bacterium]